MIGFLTLLRREVNRFLKDAFDTILPPTVSVILYMLIFGIALGLRMGEVDGIPYLHFILPGLILLTVIQNSFLNSAYSLFQSRWDGNIADLLASPLSTTQIALAIVLGGVARGLIVGALVFAAALLLADFPITSAGLTLGFAVLISVTFAGLGSIVGLWTKGWEGVGAISTFVLDPLVLLGGVFYSLEMVRGVPAIELLTQINPITYIMEAFRVALFGGAFGDFLLGLLIAAGLCVLFLLASLALFRVGYHLKH